MGVRAPETPVPQALTPLARMPHLPSPEDEDEEHKQHAEGGHVVHGLHEHHELPLQRRQEAHQLQHPHQAEGPQHRQAPLPGCAQLYQAHGDNDAVKYVPLLLEVIVGVQGYDFEDHFSSKKHGKHLQTETGIHLSGVCEVVGNDKQGRGEMSCL